MTNDDEHCIDLLAETASVENLDRADLDHLCARQPDGLVRRLHVEGDDAPVRVPGSTSGSHCSHRSNILPELGLGRCNSVSCSLHRFLMFYCMVALFAKPRHGEPIVNHTP